MPIRILPPLLANQIAAGEVVERPASVVKELVENSLDAGATRIDIELEKGGCKLIRIRDNGSGIPQADLALALARHATSKVSTLDDLEAICSLGFRGEALASISSVSRLALTSRTAEQAEAWQASVEGREMEVQVRPAAHPVGTTLEVVDLFFNTPARRKFLRSEKTEYGHIDELIRRLALSRFEVSFVLKHNGKLVRQYRSATDDAGRLNRVATACGNRFLTEGLAIRSEHLGLTLTGWLLPPAPTTESAPEIQYCYVNGRVMRDKLINHAIRQGYLEALGLECSPSFVLYLQLDPHQVDVNVHPAKHEVRFHESRLVHDFIVGVVRDALMQGVAASAAERLPVAHREAAPVAPARELIREPAGAGYVPAPLRSREHGYQAPGRYTPEPIPAQEVAGFQALMHTLPLSEPLPSATASTAPPLLSVAAGGWRILSLPHPDVALLQHGGDYLLLNLRRAERLLLSRRLERQLGGTLIAQPLLMPLTLTLEPEGQTLFVRQEPWLRRLGIEWRASGKSRTILRVPAALRQSNLADSLPRLLQRLAELEAETPDIQTARISEWLANMTPSRLDGSLMAATQVLADLEADGPELLNLAAIRRPLPLAGWIEELLLHE